MKLNRSLALFCLLLAGLPAMAQPPAFEAATIKKFQLDPGTGSYTSSLGFTAAGFQGTASLRNLIKFAWELEDWQLEGGPAWISSEHYVVVGKAAHPASRDELKQMLRQLLTDRFKLAIHQVNKEQSVLDLARSPGPVKLVASDPGGTSTYAGKIIGR